MTNEELISKARKARENAYAPYSGFYVGAALLTKDGKVYTGANIENAGYSATVCAERVAFFKAVSEGEREFSAIAVAGGLKDGECGNVFPCGVCRQVMSEFCNGTFTIVVAEKDGGYSEYTMEDLLPHRFGPKDLSQKK